jgi:hypothetical protein
LAVPQLEALYGLSCSDFFPDVMHPVSDTPETVHGLLHFLGVYFNAALYKSKLPKLR